MYKLIWKYKTPGIPDSEFSKRDKVPITKEEVRAIQISKARLCEGDTVYDIGCGSGSITVEAAIQVGRSGKIFAIDIDANATSLSKENLEKFGITNVTVIHADGKDAVRDFPQANAIFIGGTGGDTRAIISECVKKLLPGGRIVVGVILVETLLAVIKTFEEIGFEADITQITVSKSRKTSTGTMMLARNPVTIISAEKPLIE
ncbi:MAG: precorrin-6y C5,15-methyltransferase subunit CbiT [Cenarchaeum symbiont of Oopsacas minuta]|nr:precorrin-6y C5,15-methyltransferase subunit CbiT [Cenarchaeum symbiont of Oopsacas minuta]